MLVPMMLVLAACILWPEIPRAGRRCRTGRHPPSFAHRGLDVARGTAMSMRKSGRSWPPRRACRAASTSALVNDEAGRRRPADDDLGAAELVAQRSKGTARPPRLAASSSARSNVRPPSPWRALLPAPADARPRRDVPAPTSRTLLVLQVAEDLARELHRDVGDGDRVPGRWPSRCAPASRRPGSVAERVAGTPSGPGALGGLDTRPSPDPGSEAHR